MTTSAESATMVLYRETPCEHGRLERHGPAKCKHGFDTLHVGLGAEYACGGPIAEWCSGGSREEVTIDYEASAGLLSTLDDIPSLAHPEEVLPFAKQVVDAALGLSHDH